MKKNIFKYIAIVVTCTSIFCGCGKEVSTEELVDFRTTVDSFCESINTIDTNINELNIQDSNYQAVLMDNLNQLNDNFKVFADIDFPKDYNYLETLADEASTYMDTAVSSYEDIFANNYTEEAMLEKYNYASENYQRAYKRIQIIITFLNGEKTSDDVVIE